MRELLSAVARGLGVRGDDLGLLISPMDLAPTEAVQRLAQATTSMPMPQRVRSFRGLLPASRFDSQEAVVACVEELLHRAERSDKPQVRQLAERLNALLSDRLLGLIGYKGSILFLGAHSDDLEIACGGTILRLAAKGVAGMHYALAVDCGDRRSQEALSAAFDMGIPRENTHLLGIWKDGTYAAPGEARLLEERLAELRDRWHFDTVFCHRLGDSHKDHQAVAEAAMRIFRRKERFLMFYIHKVQRDWDPFDPCMFVDVTEFVERKMALLRHFESQSGKLYVDLEVQKAILRSFGAMADCEYAEAFTVRRAVW